MSNWLRLSALAVLGAVGLMSTMPAIVSSQPANCSGLGEPECWERYPTCEYNPPYCMIGQAAANKTLPEWPDQAMRAFQRRLNKEGYNISITGRFNPETREALQDLLQKRKFAPIIDIDKAPGSVIIDRLNK